MTVATTEVGALRPLLGRTALVTGGSRGIGAAISRELSDAGARIAVNFHTNHEAAALVLADLRPREPVSVQVLLSAGGLASAPAMAAAISSLVT